MSTDLAVGAPPKPRAARRRDRGGFSLLELAAVVAMIGLLAGAAAVRFGEGALAVTRAEGFTRKLSLGLRLARRQAIAGGDNAALVLTRDGGAVTGWTIVRVTPLGDELAEAGPTAPDGLSLKTTADRWEFDYTGAAVTPAGGGTLRVDAAPWSWTIQVYGATGGVEVTKLASL